MPTSNKYPGFRTRPWKPMNLTPKPRNPYNLVEGVSQYSNPFAATNPFAVATKEKAVPTSTGTKEKLPPLAPTGTGTSEKRPAVPTAPTQPVPDPAAQYKVWLQYAQPIITELMSGMAPSGSESASFYDMFGPLLDKAAKNGGKVSISSPEDLVGIMQMFDAWRKR